jgi:hypothetical protein
MDDFFRLPLPESPNHLAIGLPSIIIGIAIFFMHYGHSENNTIAVAQFERSTPI